MSSEKHDVGETSQLYIRTPLIESYELSKIAGCRVHLKMENLQPSDSFKLRGISHMIKRVDINFHLTKDTEPNPANCKKALNQDLNLNPDLDSHITEPLLFSMIFVIYA